MGEIWRKCYVTCLEGVGHLLCDPEIATIDLWVKKGGTKSEFYFCLGNLSTNAIHGFM